MGRSRGLTASAVPLIGFVLLLLRYRIRGDFVYVRYRFLVFRKLNKGIFAVLIAVLLKIRGYDSSVGIATATGWAV
jgi:hypothetical protein